MIFVILKIFYVFRALFEKIRTQNELWNWPEKDQKSAQKRQKKFFWAESNPRHYSGNPTQIPTEPPGRFLDVEESRYIQ